MASKPGPVLITLGFNGFWRDAKRDGVPSHAGVYCVYRCTHDAAKKQVSLKQLLYIGQSANVHDRTADHEMREECWNGHLQDGEILCYSTAPASPEATRLRAEAAMIYEHKPSCNTEYVDEYPYEEPTQIDLLGKADLLHAPSFVVVRDH